MSTQPHFALRSVEDPRVSGRWLTAVTVKGRMSPVTPDWEEWFLGEFDDLLTPGWTPDYAVPLPVSECQHIIEAAGWVVQRTA